jgi:hypothetical protein
MTPRPTRAEILDYHLWQAEAAAAPRILPTPTHEQIATEAYKLWQDYSAAGYDIPATTIWLEAESILTSYVIGTGKGIATP